MSAGQGGQSPATEPRAPDGLPAPPVPCGLCSLCHLGARPEASSSTHPPSVVPGVAAPRASSSDPVSCAHVPSAEVSHQAAPTLKGGGHAVLPRGPAGGEPGPPLCRTDGLCRLQQVRVEGVALGLPGTEPLSLGPVLGFGHALGALGRKALTQNFSRRCLDPARWCRHVGATASRLRWARPPRAWFWLCFPSSARAVSLSSLLKHRSTAFKHRCG